MKIFVPILDLEFDNSIQPTDELLGWMDDVGYLQVGFVNINHLFDFNSHPIALESMTMFDNLRSISGCDDPVDIALTLQGILPLEQSLIYKWEPYKYGICLWNKHLVEIRNKILIGVRALIQDKDPEIEYGHFISAGGTDFLDYPRLCP